MNTVLIDWEKITFDRTEVEIEGRRFYCFLQKATDLNCGPIAVYFHFCLEEHFSKPTQKEDGSLISPWEEMLFLKRPITAIIRIFRHALERVGPNAKMAIISTDARRMRVFSKLLTREGYAFSATKTTYGRLVYVLD